MRYTILLVMAALGFITFAFASDQTPNLHHPEYYTTSDQPTEERFRQIADSATELIENGSFEVDANGNGVPDFWRMSVGGHDCTQARSYRCSVLFTEGPVIRRAKQKVRFAGHKGDEVFFQYWYKTSPQKHVRHDFHLKIVWHHTDGTVRAFHEVLWFRHPSDWAVFDNDPAIAVKDYLWMSVTIWYQSDQGSAWIDDVSLTIQPAL